MAAPRHSRAGTRWLGRNRLGRMGDEVMSDNVVNLNVVTRLDLPPERILNAALEADLSEVVIIGRDQDGNEYFASSIADGADVVWLAQRMTLKLVSGDFT